MFGFLDATRKALRSVRHFVRDTLSNRHTMDSSRMDTELMADAHTVRDEDAALEPQSLVSPSTAPPSQLNSPDSNKPAVLDHAEAADPAQSFALSASRKILQAATGLSSQPSTSYKSAPTSPISSKRLRRLPSASAIFTQSRPTLSTQSSTEDLPRPKYHQRSNTIAFQPHALRVRPRSSSHPDVRAVSALRVSCFSLITHVVNGRLCEIISGTFIWCTIYRRRRR